MRRLALVVAGLIIAAFLVLPMLYATRVDVRVASARLPVAPDEPWNPGPFSDAHRSFANNCSECHQKPFVRVPDQACIHCHEQISDHVPDKDLQAKVFGNTRCAQCHLEHKGNDGLMHGNAGLCVDCHADIKAKVARSTLPGISDFGAHHPPFKLTLPLGPGMLGWKRVSQADPDLAENSGLKFPHDIHVADDGVASPNGRLFLKCKSCHEPDEAGMRYKPIVMQQHCAGCHRLAFEPAVTRREVPHGSPAAVMTVLREFYAGISIGERAIDVVTVDGLLQRPGNDSRAVARRQASAWSEAKAMTIARDLFEVRVCASCHQVQRMAENHEVPWQIAPVSLNLQWLPKSRFDHSKHGNVGCVGCHDAAGSGRSADIIIPSIATCRRCHVGTEPMRNMITSNCASCHGFHAGLDSFDLDKVIASPHVTRSTDHVLQTDQRADKRAGNRELP